MGLKDYRLGPIRRYSLGLKAPEFPRP